MPEPSAAELVGATDRIKKWAPQLDEAVRLIGIGCSLEEAAAASKINVKTLKQWMADPRFDKKYQEISSAVNMRCVNMATSAIQCAIETLVDIMKATRQSVDENGNTITEYVHKPSDRLKASEIAIKLPQAIGLTIRDERYQPANSQPALDSPQASAYDPEEEERRARAILEACKEGSNLFEVVSLPSQDQPAKAS